MTSSRDHLNRQCLESLWAEGRMPIRRSPLFDRVPSGQVRDWSRVEGMLLGLAIGDALGNTTEGQSATGRAGERGEIRDYLPNWYADDRAVGLPSDDSQLAFWTVEHLVEHRGLDPAALARVFATRWIFGIGSAVRRSQAQMARGVAWQDAAPHSAGNGALMRIAPMVLPHLRTPSPFLWTDTALSARVTHNDSSAVAACLAFVEWLWRFLTGLQAANSTEWFETFVATVRALEGEATYRPRGGRLVGFEGTLSAFLARVMPDALDRNLSTLEASNGWYSGAFLLETVPCVLYILLRHGHDLEEAIVRAVNDTRDNAVGAIVGAAVGALHGTDALPRRWRDGQLGRTAAADDGRVFELIEQARQVFWDEPSTPEAR